MNSTRKMALRIIACILLVFLHPTHPTYMQANNTPSYSTVFLDAIRDSKQMVSSQATIKITSTAAAVILPIKPGHTGTESSASEIPPRQIIYRHNSRKAFSNADHLQKIRRRKIRENSRGLFGCKDDSVPGDTRPGNDKTIISQSNWASKNNTAVARSSFSPSVANLRCKRRSFGVGPPAFHPSSPTNVTAQLGANAYLRCRIKNLGNKSVSWFRKRDRHILTVDRVTFIADGRFSAWHEGHIQSWTLHIRYVQPRDAGIYECQVSTEPKMSLDVTLAVLEPSTVISGEKEQYVKVGSTVNVRCLIQNAVEEPEYIFWYQNGLRLVQAGNENLLISASRIPPSTSIITLTILSVTMKDSGNYTCSPALIPPASFTLHVLHDEHPAAMQDGTTGAAADLHHHSHFQFILFSVIFFLLYCSAFGYQVDGEGHCTSCEKLVAR